MPGGRRGILGVPTFAQMMAMGVHLEYADGIAIPATGVVIGTNSQDIAVTWPNGGFSTTTYLILKPQCTKAAVILGGNLDAVVKTGSVTKTGCTVTVTTNTTLAIGNATLSVLAISGGI